MPFVRALLLYFAAVGAGEALLAGAPVSPGLQPAQHAVLPGYQIVLPLHAGGVAPSAATQYSAPSSPFRSTIYPPLHRTIHAFSPANTVHPFSAAATTPALHPFVPVAAPLIDNFVEPDARSASPYAVQSPVARPQHALPTTTYYGQNEGLSGVTQYQETVFGSRVQAVPSRPQSLVHSRTFQNSADSVQATTDLTNPRFLSSHQTPRQYQVSQHTTADFGSNSYSASRQAVPEISDRHYQTVQQAVPEYRVRQFPQHQQIIDSQQFPSSRVEDGFAARSQISENFGSYGFAYTDPNERNHLLLPEGQHRIQQDRYNNVQRTNGFRSNDEQSLQTSYLQSNALSLPVRHDIQVIPQTPTTVQGRSSLEPAQPGQGHHQSYRVDVEGNGYGYRYAVQNSHETDISNRQGEGIVAITPSSHHGH